MKAKLRAQEDIIPVHDMTPVYQRKRKKLRPQSELKFPAENEYAFLLNNHIDQPTLETAIKLSEKWQTPVHDVLISQGHITQAQYTKALAEECDVNFIQKLKPKDLHLSNIPEIIQENYRAGLFTGKGDKPEEDTVILASHAPQNPTSLKSMMNRLGTAGQRIFLVSTHQLRFAITAMRGSLLTKQAIFGLESLHPGCSAKDGLTNWQKFSLFIMISAIASFFLFYPEYSFLAGSAALSILFFPVVWLRLVTCLHAFRHPYVPRPEATSIGYWRAAASGLTNDATLPVYTILVPIFREKEVLSNLFRALLDLDYPSAKLDIKLIFEETDPETLQAAMTYELPDNIEFIVVPDSQPRTKPKALNYAMQFARGDYVVIYDAEDQPVSDQLRKAVTAFRLAPDSVACLQARLTFYNASENWLTKQFALEYASLFNGILPTLQRLDFPIPLGGTSNHFRMSALKNIGAWDAFNVTEDADLGMRLYRSGYTCRVLNSVTYEEATCSLKAWIPQRTRWLKGWMQTYAVHMRNPFRLYRQLGFRGFAGFQVMMGGFVMSALIHPVFLIYAAWYVVTTLMQGRPLFVIQLSELNFWLISLFNLTFGYTTAMALGAIIGWQAKMKTILHNVITMPIYWLFISFAAYRALYQFFRAPFLWEKTSHGVTKVRFVLSKE